MKMSDNSVNRKVVTNVEPKRVATFAMDSFGSMKPTPETMASLKQNTTNKIGKK